MIDDSVLLNDWHVVARSEELAEGTVQQARLLCEDLVLWRCNGRVQAWQDLCVHRGARLSLGWLQGDTLVCPYHGWEYNSEGRCVRIPAHPQQEPPAKACVRTYKVQERYGLIWVSLGNLNQDVPSFPEWDDPTYRKIFCGPYPCRSSGPRIIESFVDVAHFSFVHEGVLGDPKNSEIDDYKVFKFGYNLRISGNV